MNSRFRQFVHDEWLQLLILVVPLVAALVATPFATHNVPMQWNLRGQVNWYAPKEWGLLVLPAALLLTYGIIFWREALDSGRVRPEDGSLSSHGRTTRTIRLVISLAAVAACFVQIASAMGRHPDMGRMGTAVIPLLLAYVGNLFGKLKPNKYMGVRVPWTLRSETVWRKTHRVAGWLYTVSGLIVAALCLFAPQRYFWEITVIWLVVIIFGPLIAAWQASRQEAVPAGQPRPAMLGPVVWVEFAVILGVLYIYLHQAISDPRHEPQRQAAQASAEQWLTHVNDGRYADAWKATGVDFRKKVKEAQLVASLEKVRKPLGAMRSRHLGEASYKDSLSDAPPGHYVIVHFDTEFENKPGAVETVVEVQEPDGQWQVSGYFIK